MNTSFWDGKRVLITGHTGFKGSWLTIWLKMLRANVHGYALDPPTEPNLYTLAGVDSGIVSVHGDTRDLSHLKSVMKAFQPEIVIHMAAQTIVRESYANPVETMTVNVIGTVHVLEAAAECKSVKVALVITSDKCYENMQWSWGYRENDQLGGNDPYSCSKACVELITKSYRASYFSPNGSRRSDAVIASARAGNVIGGGDWAKDRLIPDVLRAIETGKCVKIRNPISTRPWQHVLVPLSGYLNLVERLWTGDTNYAQPWNFGPDDGDAKPVSWIVEYLCKKCGNGACWELDDEAHPHEDTYLKLDCSSAQVMLKWYPKIPLYKALDWIVEFYRAYLSGDDLRPIVESQIQRFQEM